MARYTHAFTTGCLFPPALRSTLALLIGVLVLVCAASAQGEGRAEALKLGQPFERELRGGETHAYLIQATAGQYLQVSVEQFGVDVRAVMFAPGGGKWAEADSTAGTQGTETLFGIIEEAGNFRLEVRPAQRDGAGKYRVQLEALRPATERDATLLAASRTYQEAVRLADEGSKESLQRAILKYEEALRLYRTAGSRRDEANLLNHLGSTHSSLGDKQKALDLFNRALQLYQRLGDRRRQATALSNIGDTYGDLGEAQKSLVYYSRALPLSREAGDRYGEASILSSLGSLAVTWGQKENALRFYQEALRVRRDVGHRRGEASTLNSIGVLYADMGQRQHALEYYRQALAAHREVGNLMGEAITLTNLGAHYEASRAWGETLEYYNSALNLVRAVGARADEARLLQHLAYVARERGELAKALRLAEEAVGIVETVRGKFDTQEMRASYFATVGGYYEFYIDLLMRLHGQSPHAGYNARAFHASERARARSLLETLAGTDIRQGADPALVARERALRQRVYAVSQRQMKLAADRHTPEQALALAGEMETLSNELQQVEAQLRRASPQYASLTQPSGATPQEIQAGLLDADTVLLEFSLGRERSYLWVVTPNALHSFQLPKSAELEEAARAFHSSLTAAGRWEASGGGRRGADILMQAPAAGSESAAALSRILLDPAAKFIGGKRLLIVCDGALQYIPFGALPDPSPAGKDVGYQPLILKHEVIHSPSASSLLTIRRQAAERPRPAKTLAVLADPVFDKTDERVTPTATLPKHAGDDVGRAPSLPSALARSARAAGARGGEGGLERLPGTRVEAERILALVPPSERKQALDFAASRAAATDADMGRYRYVHIATHGFLNSVHPELSGLVLSLVDERGAPLDGFLQAHEIYDLKLSADLVVLSACQTGLGKEIRGEGLVGLTRGFMYAGAPRVVVSLCSVNDEATAELMSRFYHKLIKDGMRPAQALREAQLSLLKEERWAAPYYWAAFTLHGEWQ